MNTNERNDTLSASGSRLSASGSTKSCPFCGAALPSGAYFCPTCAKALNEKSSPALPVIRPRPKLWLVVLVAVVLTLVGVVILRHRPRTLDDKDTAEIVYEVDGHAFRLILRTSQNDDFHKDAQSSLERRVPPGLQFAIPLQLYVFDPEGGTDIRESFLERMESASVTVEAMDSHVLPEISRPSYNEGFPRAALESDVICTSECGHFRLTFSLQMKNGDTLVLHEAVSIEELPEKVYSYENTPLSTVEEVQALLDSFADGDDTMITIILAPTVYEGDLTFGGHYLTLMGGGPAADTGAVSANGASADASGTADESGGDVGRTEFHGTIYIEDGPKTVISIAHIDFVGDGTGVGIESAVSFFADECSFTNLAIGIDGTDGSWPIPMNCTFENCGVGFRMDSTRTFARSALFVDLSFINNGTAVQFIHVPSDDVLYFRNCVFTGNGTDFDIQSGNRVVVE